MKIIRLLCFFLILSHAKLSELEENTMMRWDQFEALSNRVHGIKQRDVYVYYLWELYKSSSGFKKLKVVEAAHDVVTKLAYVDSKIEMLGLILFGPKDHHSFLRAVRDKKLPMADDKQCLESTLKLFEKHCGVVAEHDMMQPLANICNYVAEKTAIKEAIIIACGMHDSGTKSHGIDVGNPEVNVTPSPIHRTFQYCGRISVNGVSRMKLLSYAKTYKVTVVPSGSILDSWHNLIQICFHNNGSQGLCQCENDWKYLQKGSWSSVMSPYERRYVDVKFVVDLEGFVTVTLDEVSELWRNGLLIGGITFLFMAGRKDIVAEDADDGVSQFSKGAVLVFALTCIFMSSADTPMAVVAVCFCLCLNYAITFIMSSGRVRRLIDEGTVDALGDGGYYSSFHKIRRRRRYSMKESEEWTRRSVTELISTPEFNDWLINNAHRIDPLDDE